VSEVKRNPVQKNGPQQAQDLSVVLPSKAKESVISREAAEALSKQRQVTRGRQGMIVASPRFEQLPVKEWAVEGVPTLKPGTVYRRVQDRHGREELREQPLILDRKTFERALSLVFEEGLKLRVQHKEFGPEVVSAVLKSAQADQPLTLHAAVRGIPATLADSSGKVVEGTLKLCGLSDASARVVGGLVGGGLKLLFFQKLVAPLTAGLIVIEIASLLLPAGDKGNPRIIEDLIVGWIKDAMEGRDDEGQLAP
jgi:hypothetical protein